MEQVTELQTTVVITPIEEEIAKITKKSQAVIVGEIALCRMYGPKPGCLCGHYRINCLAAAFYRDYALAVVAALDKAGLLKT